MQLHTLRYPVKGASQFTLSIVKDAHHHQGNKDGGMSAHRARLICLLALDCLLILFTVVLVSARHFSRPPCPLGMVLWQSVLCALFILTALLGLLYWIGGHYTY